MINSGQPSKDTIHLYLTGLCWNLAVAMRELTGFPVWVVYDVDQIEVHAFVFDECTSTAYDIRGALSITEVIKGPWKTGKTIAPWSQKIGVTKRDVSKAKTVAKRYLKND